MHFIWCPFWLHKETNSFHLKSKIFRDIHDTEWHAQWKLLYDLRNQHECLNTIHMHWQNILYSLHIKLCAYLFVCELSWEVNPLLCGIRHRKTFYTLFLVKIRSSTFIVHLPLFIFFSCLHVSISLAALTLCFAAHLLPLVFWIIWIKLICIIFSYFHLLFWLVKSDGKYVIDSYVFQRPNAYDDSKHRMKCKSFSPNYKRSWIQSRQQL